MMGFPLFWEKPASAQKTSQEFFVFRDLMPSSAYTYPVFPIEVASNTHDFDVHRVVHNGQAMRGVFARRHIHPSECSLYMGIYPGYRRSKEEIASKVSRYAARYCMDVQTALRKTCAYNLSLEQLDPGYRLDPSDERGVILPEFRDCIVCYINEPPPGHLSKAAFVYNQPRQRQEVWLLQAVGPGEEVYLYYGKQFLRDYPINSACDGRFSHYIPPDSILIPDRRGVPDPLLVPELGFMNATAIQ
jgi:hypothetical protein